MQRPLMTFMFVGAAAVAAVAIAIPTLVATPPWVESLLYSLGGFSGASVFYAGLLYVFFQRPWSEREKRLTELGAQNDVYRLMFEMTRRVGDVSSSAGTVELGLQAAVERLRDELKLEGCSVRRMGKDGMLESVVGCGYRSGNVTPMPFSSKEGVAGKAIQERRPIFVENPEDVKEFVKPGSRAAPVKSLFCYPLIENGEVIGILSGSNTGPREYTPHERDVLSLIAARLGSLLKAYSAIYSDKVEASGG